MQTDQVWPESALFCIWIRRCNVRNSCRKQDAWTPRFAFCRRSLHLFMFYANTAIPLQNLLPAAFCSASNIGLPGTIRGVTSSCPPGVNMIVCRLKSILAKKGLTRYQLQKLSGISYHSLDEMYHSRNHYYSASVLDRLCKVLQRQPGDLLKWKPPVRFPRSKRKTQ
jgi:DNA-binding Xre family transcriptional regulator